VLLAHTDVLPIIDAGAAGALPATMLAVRATEVPHEELATTDMVPPLLPWVTVMLFEVEVPVQVAGMVQV